MRVAIVHLSDIHLRSKSDVVMTRVEPIATAIAGSAISVDMVIVAVTGDVAYSGAANEYEAAGALLGSLKEALTKRFTGVPIHIAIVPGNHDCNFQGQQTARDFVIEGIQGKPQKILEVLDATVSVQTDFFQFMGTVETAHRETVSIDSRAAYAYRFQCSNGVARVVCINTACTSRLHERSGTLIVPTSFLQPDTANLTLVLMHHPFDWISSAIRRVFRREIEEIADLVLTGHEHESEQRAIRANTGSQLTYLEGGLLQPDPNDSTSSFSLVVVDAKAMRRLVKNFRWNKVRYEPDSGIDTDDEWEDLILNKRRIAQRFELDSKTRSALDDTGLNLLHRKAGNISLSQVYEFPDLREVALFGEAKPEFIPGDKALDVIRARRRVLITGDGQSGKTAMARMLVMSAVDHGDVAVLLTPPSKLPLDQELKNWVEDAFIKQYGGVTREDFRQLDPERRVLIVDDYHKFSGPKERKRKFLQQLAAFAPRLVLFASDLVLSVEELTDPDAMVALSRMRIQPLGYLRRERLVKKWLELDDGCNLDASLLAHEVDEIGRLLDGVIGKNFVPAYPVYILSVLQAREAALPVDVTASTHGYFYELFIRAALARGGSHVQYDIYSSYLSYVAYRMFLDDASAVSVGRFKRLLVKYSQRHDIELEYKDTVDDLKDKGILVVGGDEVRFKYPFMFYYFVAAHIRDHITKRSVRYLIGRLCADIGVERNANVLLFLAHLSKNPLIVRKLLKASRALYEDVPEVALGDDVAFMRELGDLKRELAVYRDRDARETREEYLRSLDEANGDDVSEEEQVGEAISEPLRRLSEALKTLQILGQVVKNFPGSLDASNKREIVAQCYSLGLRVLGWLFVVVRENKEELIKEIARMLREEHPGHAWERVVNRAQRTIFLLLAMASFGMIRRISNAVGSRELTQTYEHVTQESVPAHRLIEVSLALDHSGAFPSSKVGDAAAVFRDAIVPMWILRRLVLQHFHLFPVSYRLKQRACSALGIRFEQNDIARRQQRTLPSGTR